MSPWRSQVQELRKRHPYSRTGPLPGTPIGKCRGIGIPDRLAVGETQEHLVLVEGLRIGVHLVDRPYRQPDGSMRLRTAVHVNMVTVSPRCFLDVAIMARHDDRPRFTTWSGSATCTTFRRLDRHRQAADQRMRHLVVARPRLLRRRIPGAIDRPVEITRRRHLDRIVTMAGMIHCNTPSGVRWNVRPVAFSMLRRCIIACAIMSDMPGGKPRQFSK